MLCCSEQCDRKTNALYSIETRNPNIENTTM